MSLNFVLAYLPNTDAAALSEPDDAPASFDVASSIQRPGPSVAAHGAHTLIVDPTLTLLFDPPSALETSGATVVGLSGVSDTYVLQVLGEHPRLRVFVEREVVQDDGEPLSAETVLAEVDDPEDSHLALFCRVAGIELADLARLDWRPIGE